ncbi:hypothetical protein SVAN01_04487 [Stagonosporopsis vannaccii]|nr:hypothetical protein SVAN01_04487 [Stagonosporopsis vannaccii]
MGDFNITRFSTTWRGSTQAPPMTCRGPVQHYTAPPV